MEQSNGLGGARIALLIDFDNVILGIDDPGFDVELVVNALRERGTIVVSRVYGDWYRHNRHRRKLMEHGLELVEAPAFGPVIKNSADIKIALDGFEIGMTMPHINTFCLVSGDSDFLPLIKKLQGLGKNVLVICGNRFTSDMLRRNCNEFISYENLLAASYGADEDATTLEGAFALLHRAMAALRERGSEIRTSTLKQMMIQLNPVFSEKTFGYSQFRGFLDKAGREGLIKLGPRDRISGEFYVLLPEEDEAEVIDKVERAEPAAIVEKIVEARGGRRGAPANERQAHEDNRTDNRNNGRGEGRNQRREETESDAGRPEEFGENARPRSRREARLAAAQANVAQTQVPHEEAAPLATPLTPATDFSPASASESEEMTISRRELMERGLRRGSRFFSAKSGNTQPLTSQSAQPTAATLVATDAALTSIETPPKAALAALPEGAPIDADLLAPEAVTGDSAALEVPETQAPPNQQSAPEAENDKPKRSRSRRRKKTGKTSAEDELAPAPDQDAGDQATTLDASGETASGETTPAKAVEASETADEPAALDSASQSVSAPAETSEPETAVEVAPKPKRTRRRKKSESDDASGQQKPDAQQTETPEVEVTKQEIIEASADTPAAEKPRTRRRRTSRKQAEETAQTLTDVSEHIVTTDQTTGEVTQQQLAQIPVPQSEDEL